MPEPSSSPKPRPEESRSARVVKRAEPIEELLTRGKTWLAVLLPTYIAIRILFFAQWNPAVTLEVVRAQGLKGIGAATVISVVPVLLGLALLVLSWLALKAFADGRNWFSSCAVAGALVVALFVPSTFLALVFAIAFFLFLPGPARKDYVALFVLFLVTWA